MIIKLLGINAYKLGDNLEIDPQVNESLVKQIHNIQNKNTQWYMYRGDITLKTSIYMQYVPFDTFSSNIIDKSTEINEEKLKASQRIMKISET